MLVVREVQLADDGVNHYLRLAPVEFVEQRENLRFNLFVPEDDDRVGAIVGDDLGTANDARLGGRLALARAQAFGKRGAAAAEAGRAAQPAAVVVRIIEVAVPARGVVRAGSGIAV